jgi:hypothetical protein
VLPRVPSMLWCENSRSIMYDRPIYSPIPFFHYLSFICVLSLSTRSEDSGLHVSRIYHSYFVSDTSKPTWVRVESSVRFFLKTVKMIGTVVTKIHRYFTLVCHWLSGMIVLLCIWNVFLILSFRRVQYPVC